MSFLISTVSFLFVIMIIVVFHEFGHYIVAKLCKVGVKEFSVGFGKKLFGIKWGETEYVLRPIPVGGFVDLEGMDTPDDEEVPNGFHTKPLWARISVLFAGPLMNFVLAAFIFFIIDSFIGVQTPVFTKQAFVGEILENTAAAKSKLEKGDKILKVNGHEIINYEQFRKMIKKMPDQKANFYVQRFNEKLNIKVNIGDILFKDPKTNKTEKLGFLGISPASVSIIGQVRSHSPAENAGIKVGDTIIKINDCKIEVFQQISAALKKYSGQPVSLTYIDGKTKTEKVVTIEGEIIDRSKGPLIGVAEKSEYGEKLPIFSGMISGINRTYFYTYKMLEYLSKLFHKSVSTDSLSGPIGIASEIGKHATDFIMLLTITGIISINIGLINLFPFPALDGGRLVFLIIEGLRGGKKISTKVEEMIHTTGLTLLLLLMVFVTYKDILKMFKAPVKKPPIIQTQKK